MEKIIGIDLGTTNSEVAILCDGQPLIIGKEEEAILPSVVVLSADGELLVGQAAKNQYWKDPGRGIKSIKRKMGTNEKVQLGDRVYSPQEISAMILKTLHKRAEKHLGETIKKAVITVPAYFSDAQRQATRDAGEIAGLDVVRIINEPTAAALTYESDLTTPQKIMVYDLGGGTFDVSVVSIGKGVVEVLSSHGDSHLGGDDFDELLVQHILKEIKEKHNVDIEDRTARGRIIRAAEKAKKQLSYHAFTTIELSFITSKNGVPLNLSMEISRDDYQKMIESLIDKTIESVDIALRGAKLHPKDLDKILLVGGSTRTPLVSEKLEKLLGKCPRQDIHPDLCVAMGASIQGGVIAGEEVSSVLVDITPYTFGTSCFGMLDGAPYPEVYCPIIKHYTPLPVSRSQVFYTMSDYQRIVDVKVFQGENEDAQKNIEIGKFALKGLSKVPAGNEIIAKFDLDLNGILKVTAIEKRTNKSVQITIDNAISQFESEEIEEAKSQIKRLFDEPEQDLPPGNATLIREADSLVGKVKSLTCEIPKEDSAEMERLIEKIEDAKKDNDEKSLQNAIDNLADILYYYQ